MIRTTCRYALTCAALFFAIVDHVTAQTQDSSPAPRVQPIGAQNSLQAVFAEKPPRIDGIMDDEIWQQTPVADDFVQLDPIDGAPPSQPSAMRIAYDKENLYFGLSFYDSDPEQIRARNLQRGGPNGNDDMFWLLIDTYNDDRNAYLFETNVLGTQDDAIITDESMSFSDWQWDGIYESQGRIADDGWHVELAIPFKTIRFDNKDELTMGVAIMRFLNRTGERSLWPYIPRRYAAGIFQVSQYANLEGIEGVKPGRNVLIKPYVISGAQKSRVTENGFETDTDQDLGLDVKWALTPNFTFDATLNTDFAQVESDNVQLDLTRFNLFFPEKREFFLERQGLFEFGNTGQTQTFFSRRIGISNDILAGGRLVGQFDKVSIGAMNLQTDDNNEFSIPGGNNTVLRARVDVIDRTTVGAIFTNLEQDNDWNRGYGADLRRRFWGNSEFSAWFSRIEDKDPDQSDGAGSVSLALRSADWTFGADYDNVGRRFNPALGFVRRRDMKSYATSATYNPFLGDGFFRSYAVTASAELIDGQDNEKQSSDLGLNGNLRFRTNDRINWSLGRNFERLDEPFFLRSDVELAPGDYVSNSGSVGFRTDNSKFFSASGTLRFAEFFGGDRTTYQVGIGLRTGKYLNMDATVSHQEFDLPVPNGTFNATTFGMNLNAAWSRKLFANSLIQYDNFSGDLQANVRIDWIHSPGADLFIVFNTSYNFTGEDDQFDVRNAILNDRVGIAKLTYVIQL